MATAADPRAHDAGGHTGAACDQNAEHAARSRQRDALAHEGAQNLTPHGGLVFQIDEIRFAHLCLIDGLLEPLAADGTGGILECAVLADHAGQLSVR